MSKSCEIDLKIVEVALDSLPDPVIVMKPDHSIVRVNQAGYEKLRIEKSKLNEIKCYETFNQKNNCTNCLVNKAIASLQVEKMETFSSILNKHVERRATPVINENGEVEFIIEHLKDIEKEKRLQEKEESLDKLTKEYETIFNNAQDAIYILEAIDENTFKFIRSNVYHQQLTGFTQEEIKGKVVEEVYSNSVLNKIIPKLKKCYKYGEVVEYEISFKHKSKLVTWYTKISPVIKNNQVVQIVGSSRDITKRKQAEQKLAENKKEIEDLYSKLNAEIDKARRIHELTLPKELPNIEGISFTVNYQPANKLGGDFYDIKQIGNKVLLYISDVSGHGLDAAIMSRFVKDTITDYLFVYPEEKMTPKNILTFLTERYNNENYPEDYFISIFMVLLNLDTLELTYTGAGIQNPPLLDHGNNEGITELVSKGLPITSALPVEMLDFEEDKIKLKPGSTILLNTDGLTEQLSGQKYYKDRLYNLFSSCSHLPPYALKKIINDDFTGFNDGSLQGDDDVTYLVLGVDEPDKEVFNFDIDSRMDNLDVLYEKVDGVLPDLNNREKFLITIYELANNAIKHGNKLDPNKKVYLKLIYSKKYVVAEIEDEGEGFDWKHKIKGLVEMSKECNRGKGLIVSDMCCSGLYYNRKGNRAVVVINNNQAKTADAS